MAERELVIKFIGQDAGLTALANKSSDSIERLGEAFIKPDRQAE